MLEILFAILILPFMLLVVSGIFVVILSPLILYYGISWIATCGVVYLITLCFGWDFSWLMATGVWASAYLIKSLFFRNKKD